jgi:hypothetical protein
MNRTKSGHKIRPQNCFSEYCQADNVSYKGYEYFLSCSILYIYEDKHLVFSREVWHEKQETRHNWAKYFIEELIKRNSSALMG